MDLPSVSPDDVLTQATRARLFALLGDLGRAAPTEELAQRLGLHPNGIRIHLERLLEAGVVVAPGSYFGAAGEGYVRFALVPSEEECARGVELLEDTL